jgi:uncharacterized membrane protein YccC
MKLDRAAALFSLNSFAAAMLSLLVAFAIGLPQPMWAMTTAYIVSQPLSGAVRSKAIYRLAGTLLGGAAAVLMVPALVQAPVLLALALAGWVGVCLAVSLLDRTPRSYLMMLAGYTAAIVAFPSVNAPEAIFDTAVTRVIEIGLGILCATLVHSVVFPRGVGDALRRRSVLWLADADRWALDVLRTRDAAAATADRRHLAAAASEIHLLATHLPFDTSRLRERTGEVQTLHARMVLLFPALAAVADRLGALAAHRDAEVRELVDAVADWIERGAPHADRAQLAARLETLATLRRHGDWESLLVESLLVRLGDVVALLGDAHALLRRLNDPRAALPEPLAAAVEGSARQPLHSDLPLAIRSGVAAALAVLLACALWIGTGWADGAGAAVMAAVFCCFFAALDDPVPAIVNFGVWFLVALPLSFLYAFAVLPSIDGFPMLAAVLAPPLLVAGYFVPDPRRAASALPLIIGFSNALGLQSSWHADFAAFANGNLAQFVGLFCAIFVTASIRSMGEDAGARRLQASTWRRLADLARSRQAPAPEAFAATLVDRIGLLTPKLSSVDGGDVVADAALRDLRAGMNLVAIIELRSRLAGAARQRLDGLLAGVAELFSARAGRGARKVDPAPVLAALDGALDAVAGAHPVGVVRGITGLVGLRRNLFPAAPPYVLAAGGNAR